MKFIPTSTADVEKLKARAKVLKRNLHIPHREALERAARETGYMHWHHVTLCQKESDVAARCVSLPFLCMCIQKDALKGETHYLAEATPLRYVLFTNGHKDAALLDTDTQTALILAAAGVPRKFTVDEGDPPTIEWHGSYRFEGDTVAIQEKNGSIVMMPVDPEQFEGAVQRSLDSSDVDAYLHNMDDPDSAALFDTVLTGAGLVPITREIAEGLLANGFSSDRVVEAMQAGAMYSPSRKSIFYPPEVG